MALFLKWGNLPFHAVGGVQNVSDRYSYPKMFYFHKYNFDPFFYTYESEKADTEGRILV